MTEVWSFLGFMNYYRKFIPKYVQIARPINQLVSRENANKKKALVDWTKKCQIAFEHLKHLCSQTPILAYANYKKPFKLHIDSSKHGLGAVLYQKQDDNTERVIAYASRTLSKPKKELWHSQTRVFGSKVVNYGKIPWVSIWWTLSKCTLIIIHWPYILTTAKLDATGQRWVASLANYNFKIFYKSGKLNVEADALLCIPWESAQVEHMEPLIVKTMLQSKFESEISFPEEHLPVKLLLKSMNVDTTLKLTQKDWFKETNGWWCYKTR